MKLGWATALCAMIAIGVCTVIAVGIDIRQEGLSGIQDNPNQFQAVGTILTIAPIQTIRPPTPLPTLSLNSQLSIQHDQIFRPIDLQLQQNQLANSQQSIDTLRRDLEFSTATDPLMTVSQNTLLPIISWRAGAYGPLWDSTSTIVGTGVSIFTLGQSTIDNTARAVQIMNPVSSPLSTYRRLDNGWTSTEIINSNNYRRISTDTLTTTQSTLARRLSSTIDTPTSRILTTYQVNTPLRPGIAQKIDQYVFNNFPSGAGYDPATDTIARSISQQTRQLTIVENGYPKVVPIDTPPNSWTSSGLYAPISSSNQVTAFPTFNSNLNRPVTIATFGGSNVYRPLTVSTFGGSNVYRPPTIGISGGSSAYNPSSFRVSSGNAFNTF